MGFAGAIGRDVPIGATYVYNLNYFCGFIISAAMYWALCKLSPVPACSDRWMEVSDELDDVRLAYDADGMSPSRSESHVFEEEDGKRVERTGSRYDDGWKPV